MVYASFSPDGKRLLCLALSADPGLWNVKTSKLSNELTGHKQAVIVATFSSDGSLIATGGADMSVCLSNGFSGTLIKKLPPHYTERPPHHTDQINNVVFALSDTVIVSIATKGNILRWNVAGTETDMDPTPMQGNMHTDLMMGLVVSHDSKFVATFSYDMTVRLWDVGQALAVGEPMCGTDKVFSTAFSIDDTRIIAGCEDGKVIVWNTATQEPIHHLLHDTKCIYTLVVSPDMRIVAACGAAFCLWDIKTGQMACPPLTGHTGDVWSVAFNKDGNQMVSGSRDNTIKIWDIRRAGEQVDAEAITLRGHTDYINYVSLAPDGRMLASASGDGTLRLWDTDLLDTSSDHEPPDQLHGRTKHLVLSSIRKIDVYV
jgi:WD40 repeat protein